MRLTRQQLLDRLVQQAARGGFEFHLWYPVAMRSEWPGQQAAIDILLRQRRYFALVYSHPFAKGFWRQGMRQPVAIEATSYTYRMPNGEMKTVHRKAYTKRTLKPGAWQYHLREMTMYEDPLRYLRRFLVVEPDPRPPVRPRFIL